MVAVLAAAVLAGTGGWIDNAKLDARAAWIAGKHVQAFCTTSDAAWQAFGGHSAASYGERDGYTPTVGGTQTFLAPAVCDPVLARLGGRRVNLRKLGAAIEVVAHESFHLRGISDEAMTECAAIRVVPSFLTAEWGFRRGSRAYKQVLLGARDFHAAASPQFRAVC